MRVGFFRAEDILLEIDFGEGFGWGAGAMRADFLRVEDILFESGLGEGFG